MASSWVAVSLSTSTTRRASVPLQTNLVNYFVAPRAGALGLREPHAIRSHRSLRGGRNPLNLYNPIHDLARRTNRDRRRAAPGRAAPLRLAPVPRALNFWRLLGLRALFFLISLGLFLLIFAPVGIVFFVSLSLIENLTGDFPLGVFVVFLLFLLLAFVSRILISVPLFIAAQLATREPVVGGRSVL